MRAEIIIPTFRREEQLGRAIESVLSEGLSDIGIIVVDDSPERSAQQTARRYGDAVKYVSMDEPSGGVPALVRNRALAEATGDIVFFLDDDDRITPGGLVALIEALEANPDVGVAFGRVDCVGPCRVTRDSYRSWFGWAAQAARKVRWSKRLTVAVIMFRGTMIINSCCAIRRTAALELGGYDASIPVYEDVEFFTRGIRSFGHVFVDQDVLEYQTGMPSIIHDLDGDGAPVHASYEIMHGKYRDLHGEVEYRLMQIAGKFVPLPRMT